MNISERRDYDAIAAAIKSDPVFNRNPEGVIALADALQLEDLTADNPRFDREHFLQNCGVANV